MYRRLPGLPKLNFMTIEQLTTQSLSRDEFYESQKKPFTYGEYQELETSVKNLQQNFIQYRDQCHSKGRQSDRNMILAIVLYFMTIFFLIESGGAHEDWKNFARDWAECQQLHNGQVPNSNASECYYLQDPNGVYVYHNEKK